MATYKGIKGVKVQSLASDPPAAQSIGQLWYNTASSVLKYSIEGAGAWASSNNTNTAVDLAGYCGIQTAAMYFGGRSAGPATDTSETYNGTSWTETADLTSATYQNAGFGTTTAAISAGGLPLTANTFTSNGTSWTAANDMQTSKRDIHGTGTQTAGMVAGGSPPPVNAQAVETYNGTSWTEVNNLIAPRIGIPIVGTTTAAMAIGGLGPSLPSAVVVETYDGTSWTEGADLNEARIWAGGAGTTTLALVFAGYGGGGATTPSATGESWNGTAWSSITDLATARTAVGSGQASPNTAALCFGGEGPPILQITEEWTEPVLSTKTVTVS